jgi:uncharacterized coiled-coil protein SlyX
MNLFTNKISNIENNTYGNIKNTDYAIRNIIQCLKNYEIYEATKLQDQYKVDIQTNDEFKVAFNEAIIKSIEKNNDYELCMLKRMAEANQISIEKNGKVTEYFKKHIKEQKHIRVSMITPSIQLGVTIDDELLAIFSEKIASLLDETFIDTAYDCWKIIHPKIKQDVLNKALNKQAQDLLTGNRYRLNVMDDIDRLFNMGAQISDRAKEVFSYVYAVACKQKQKKLQSRIMRYLDILATIIPKIQSQEKTINKLNDEVIELNRIINDLTKQTAKTNRNIQKLAESTVTCRCVIC